jgi:hypothetical protein
MSIPVTSYDSFFGGKLQKREPFLDIALELLLFDSDPEEAEGIGGVENSWLSGGPGDHVGIGFEVNLMVAGRQGNDIGGSKRNEDREEELYQGDGPSDVAGRLFIQAMGSGQ